MTGIIKHSDISLLREFDAGWCGAQNPHVLPVHSGSCAPSQPTSNPLATISVAMYNEGGGYV